MRKTFLFRAVTRVVAVFSLITVSSCIDKKYTLSEENLDLNVHVFQKGVCLPLGSTDTISLGGLMQNLDLSEDMKNFFQSGEDGSYALTYGPETMDMSENLSSLSGAVDIDKVDFSQSVEFNLSGVDVGDISYEGQPYGFEKNLSGEISGMDVEMDPIDSPFTIDANLRSFNLGDVSWDMNIGNHGSNPNFAYLPSSLKIPSALLEDASLRDYEMSMDEMNAYLEGGEIGFNAEVSDISARTELKNSFPKDVLSVSDMHVAQGAKLKVTVAIHDPFFTSGEIVPHLDINLSSVFHLHNDGEAIHDDHIDSDFILSADNPTPWTAVGEYDIEGLVIDPEEDWIYPDPNDPESVLHLNKIVDIDISGTLHDDALMTTPGTLDAWMQRHPVVDGKRNLDVVVDIEFVDFRVDDVTMQFRPKSIEREEQFEISIPSMEFPSLVTKVENVMFDEESPVKFTLSASNLAEIGDIDFNVKALELVFPDKFIVEGADEDNRVVLDGVNLREKDMTEDIVIKGFKLDAPDANGVVPAYTGIVDVIAKAEIGGEVHTGNLPETKEDDIMMQGSVSGEISIKDFDATLSGYEVNSETDPDLFKPEEIKIEIPESLSDVDGLVVYLKNDPAIEINIAVPQTSFDIRPMGAQGLVITFPDMLSFKDGGNYEEWFDRSHNALVFSSDEDFPTETIVMPIDHIIINPEKGDDGKWYSVGEVRIDGGVGINEGEIVTKKDLDDISEKGAVVKFEAVIPELEPETVGMDSYVTPVDMSFEFAPLKGVELPEMLNSVNDIIFDEVYLSLEMKTGEGFPSIGDNGTLALGLDLMLPDFIIVDDDRYKDGKLEISDDFVKTGDGLKLVADPVRIKGLDLNMEREQLSQLADSIYIKGNVTLTGAELDIDEWTGKSHNIDIIADIKTIKPGADALQEDKVLIKEVTGVVNYEIEPVDIPIDLSGIASALNGSGNMSVTLDIKTFYLALGVKTNLGVPVKAELCMTPYFGGKSKPGESKTLTLEPASSSSEMKETRYWISNNPPASGLGYEYEELDLLDILFADESRTVIADSLKVSLWAAADSTQECRFEPSAEYQLEVDYVAGVPLELGDKFKLEYRDTLDTLDPAIIQLFGYGSIGLGGSVESTIPLNINLAVNMLDTDGNVVEMGEGIGRQLIKAGGMNGEAVKTPLNLVLGKKTGTEMPEISAIELIFSADSKDVSGVPLTSDTYLRCILNARIPEGISVDLKKLLEDMQEEDDQLYEE